MMKNGENLPKNGLHENARQHQAENSEIFKQWPLSLKNFDTIRLHFIALYRMSSKTRYNFLTKTEKIMVEKPHFSGFWQQILPSTGQNLHQIWAHSTELGWGKLNCIKKISGEGSVSKNFNNFLLVGVEFSVSPQKTTQHSHLTDANGVSGENWRSTASGPNTAAADTRAMEADAR